ncbi:MAG TPA: DUF5995 family protein [Rhodothermales bacterium]|nr:DUF5995 family protein [Rhodothermales bacterium]
MNYLVTDRMQNLIALWDDTEDRRVTFLRCYSMMTQNMLTALDNNRFQDATWVSRLLTRFAEYYFEALEAFERNPRESPAAWYLAHQHTHLPQTLAVRDLLLGVNAHINYDLALTLVELMDGEWANQNTSWRLARREDYDLVNTIIAETINAVQSDILAEQDEWTAVVDAIMGPMDEWLISRFVTHWRNQVWEDAVQMLEAPLQNRFLMQMELEKSALNRAKIIAPAVEQFV